MVVIIHSQSHCKTSSIFGFSMLVALLVVLLPCCQSAVRWSMVEEGALSPQSSLTGIPLIPVQPEAAYSVASTVTTLSSCVLTASSDDRVEAAQEEGAWYADTSQERLPVKSGSTQKSKCWGRLSAEIEVCKEKAHPQVSIPAAAFGAAAWKKYFRVDVGQEPPLPKNIEDILNKQAPFLLENEESPQRVRDNHLLTLLPAEVNGEAFTLDKLGELILPYFPNNNKQEVGNNSHGYGFYSGYLTSENRTKPLYSSSHWLLLPKTILEGSRSKSFSEQKNMLSAYCSSGYRLPRALEVATSLLSHYVRSGEYLYTHANSQGRWTYTRCSDLDQDGDFLVVGGFELSGLHVDSNFGDHRSPGGVSCCREF